MKRLLICFLFIAAMDAAFADRVILLPDYKAVQIPDGISDDNALVVAQRIYPNSFSCIKVVLGVFNEIKTGSLQRFQDRYDLCSKSSNNLRLPSGKIYYDPTVYLQSPGGSVSEALSIGRLIRKLKLNVQVWRECFSSCVFILAAGVGKSLYPDARIGIHRPFLEKTPNDNIETVMRKSLADAKAYLAEMNIPEQLADVMFSTPPEHLTILTNEQLQLYRLNQMDLVASEEMALFQANRLKISRQELMRRDQLYKDAVNRECLKLLSSNNFKEFSRCDERLRKKYGLS